MILLLLFNQAGLNTYVKMVNKIYLSIGTR